MLGFEGSTSEQKISRRIISINTGVDGIFYPPSPLKSQFTLDFTQPFVLICLAAVSFVICLCPFEFYHLVIKDRYKENAGHYDRQDIQNRC